MKALPVPLPCCTKVFKNVYESNEVTPNNMHSPQFSPQPQNKNPVVENHFAKTNLLDDKVTKVGPTINGRSSASVNQDSGSNHSYNNPQANNIPYTGNNHAPQNSKSGHEDLLNFDDQRKPNLTDGSISFTATGNMNNVSRDKLVQQNANYAGAAVQGDATNAYKNPTAGEYDEELDPRILKWSHKGQIRNHIRTLLYTVQDIAWKDSDWEAIDFEELANLSQISKIYKKALVKFHSDKVETNDRRSLYLSKRICFELSVAFREFNANPQL